MMHLELGPKGLGLMNTKDKCGDPPLSVVLKFIALVTGSRSTFPLLIRVLSFEGTTKRAQNYLSLFLNILIFNSLAQNLIFGLCTRLSYFSHFWCKTPASFVSLFLGFWPKSPFFIFTSQKIYLILRGSSCCPLSGYDTELAWEIKGSKHTSTNDY